MADLITLDQLKKAVPSAKASNLEKFVEGFNETFDTFEINTPQRMAMFLAQSAHECGSFSTTEENLNYRATTLVKIWPKLFNADNVNDYAGNPEKIANRAYGNRMGNGNEESGDGYKYRGRGIIQLTGKANYTACGKELGLDLVGNPDSVKDNPVAILSAGWFWETRNLNKWADKGDVKTTTKLINGGYLGLDERTAHYKVALAALS